MIIWAILIFCVSGVRSNHTSKILQSQTFELGDDVTIKCFATKTSIGNTLVWYKQSIGQIPKSIAISYSNWKDETFMDDFNNGRFSILSDGESFHLKITALTKEDSGLYYCGGVFLNLIEFISGTHLMIKGTESVNLACGKTVANETTFRNIDSSQKVLDPVLLCLIYSNGIFVIVIFTLLVGYCKCWRKRHRGSTQLVSCEIGEPDVTYIVSFAFVPPARRSDDRRLADYSEVICTHKTHA